MITVAVSGCCGRMGRETVKAIIGDPELKLVAGIDFANVGQDVGELAQANTVGVQVTSDLAETLKSVKPQVLVDFTAPATSMNNVRTALQCGVNVVVGTTGFTPANLEEITALSARHQVNALVAPNFAIGALLMMRCAAMAAKYFNNVEIIELHHDRKIDAPSGTAIKTAEMILANRTTEPVKKVDETETIEGSRGGELEGIHIHSVRLPGFVAHQEVIFGDQGQSLTIRHDSINRECFMPGVLLAVKAVLKRPGLTYGLDHVLFED